jgi:pilus assembly protein Flp/PilA
MKTLFLRLWEAQDGQDLTEYALILALLALAAIAAMGSLGGAINNAFGRATNTVTNATTT